VKKHPKPGQKGLFGQIIEAVPKLQFLEQLP
jgi:hypothetical protein